MMPPNPATDFFSVPHKPLPSFPRGGRLKAQLLILASLLWLGACHKDTVDNLIRAQPQTLVLMAGQLGSAGNLDGSGTAARFNNPGGMVEDDQGNVYVADTGNNAIRKVAADGTVTTFVGSGASGALGDVTLKQPRDLAFNTDFTELYIADTGNHVIRVIDMNLQTGAVLAGTKSISGGYAEGAGDVAAFTSPMGISFDSSSDYLYVADSGNHRIRQINNIAYDGSTETWSSNVSTIAGSGSADNIDAIGSSASFSAPEDLTVYQSTLLVADTGNHSIRQINLSNNRVTTIAGAGTAGYLDASSGISAEFNAPSGIAAGGDTLYVADRNNHVIRELLFDDTLNLWDVSTFAGTPEQAGSADGGTADADAASAQFKSPRAITVSASGTVLLIADSGNNTLREAYFDDANVTTLAGLAKVTGSDDGPGSSASFNAPMGLVLDSAGNTYVADSLNHVIRKISPGGVVSTIAGSAGNADDTDAQGTAARFSSPTAIAIDKQGNLYVADSGNNRVRKITTNGTVSTYGEDEDGAVATFSNPNGIAVDANGNVYIAATGVHAIYKITASTELATLLAGSEDGVSGDDDGTGSEARFDTPLCLAINGSNIYVADYGNHIIRVINVDRVISKAGSVGQAGYVDTVTGAPKFNGPRALAVTEDDTIYLADSGNHAIRKISNSVSTVLGSQSSTGIRPGALPASLYQPLGIALAPSGNLLISSGNAVLMANPSTAP